MQQNTQHNAEQIASTAYSLWEQAGRPAGRDMEFWLKAEKQVVSAHRTAANPATSDQLKARQSIPDSAKPATTPAAHLIPPREKRPSPSVAARAR